MKNKQIAWYGIISTIVFAIVMGEGESASGILGLIYMASLIALYVFIIWGWVRLIKSDK